MSHPERLPPTTQVEETYMIYVLIIYTQNNKDVIIWKSAIKKYTLPYFPIYAWWTDYDLNGGAKLFSFSD